MLVDIKDILKYDVRIIVAGSRNFNNWQRFNKVMEKLIIKFHHEKLLFISGAAVSGPDRMMIEYCKQSGLDYTEIPAKWDDVEASVVKVKYNIHGKPYNALAGFARNQEMADIATHLAAFWDNVSPGTEDMIARAKKKQLTPYLFYF